MPHRLAALAATFSPTLIGVSSDTMLSQLPVPSIEDVAGDRARMVVAIATVIIQVLTFLNNRKKKKENV